jgi:hypothetical protein
MFSSEMWKLVKIYMFLVAYQCAQARMVIDTENEAPLQLIPFQPLPDANGTEGLGPKELEYHAPSVPVNAPFYNYDTLNEE